ncbi:DUF3710 domain-containing protein [Allobranchiibius sp. CTAmp26]|uniref:DUF3710 domain-containing protein n=1 Tax=Allobranchiibius sp. CTAmp26 TaxID=2815214 RepID=UPI001AA1578E|nr:DUF3710 domain-containing protein [Allobranchiibius sp. CTAmp26]MBO1755379.1 DUF3710 domain-containing protein [Allobranchiibius sp. CTAmp26]
MGIFRRKAREDGPTASGHDDDAATAEVASDDTGSEDLEATDLASRDDADDASVAVADPSASHDDLPSRLPRPHDLDRSNGPFDRSEVKHLDDRLDFGAVALRPQAGMELRLDVDEEAGNITGITAVLGESACQVQVFAAPKSGGIWDDIRDEIADGLITGGGSATEELGPLGIELAVRIPARGKDGRTTYSAARFAGVDGPRWFLRAVFSGAAATDEAAAAPLLEFVRDSVVLRGSEARAPRELLELKVPDAVAQAAEEENAGNTLNPFERGPEITEVR